MVCLNSKTYFGWGEEIKSSTKGLSKKNSFGKELWLSVLFNENILSGTNQGFRMVNGKMIKYTQEKNGLTAFYAKRKVLDDKVSTTPLDI